MPIGEWELYGHEEGSGSLDTTLKTVYNVPATTGTQLEVYYDAKDLTTMPGTVTDLSPNTNTGALSTSPPTLDTTDGIVKNPSNLMRLLGPERRPNQGTLRLPKGLLFGVQVPSDPVQGTLGRGGHRTLGPIGTRGR
jgi:hypothetical protein